MLKTLLLALITFLIDSVFLTLLFSAIMLEDPSELAIQRDALKITLPGTSLAAVSTVLNSLLPGLTSIGPFSSSMDIGISIAGIIWIMLTRRYCRIGLLEAVMLAVVAVVFCLFVFLFSVAFLALIFTDVVHSLQATASFFMVCIFHVRF